MTKPKEKSQKILDGNILMNPAASGEKINAYCKLCMQIS